MALSASGIVVKDKLTPRPGRRPSKVDDTGAGVVPSNEARFTSSALQNADITGRATFATGKLGPRARTLRDANRGTMSTTLPLIALVIIVFPHAKSPLFDKKHPSYGALPNPKEKK